MDVTPALSDDAAGALRAYAKAHDTSVQDAAREAVRRPTHTTRVELLSDRIIAEDAELLHRLAQ